MKRLANSLLSIVCLACFSAHAQLRFTKEVANIAALKQLNVNDINKTALVKDYATVGDGGGGVFEFDATSTAVPDSGMRIQPNTGSGLWIRQVDGREYMARWWGPTKTNITLQSAMNWVSSNGWGRVIADGGVWIVKSDDATRLLMQTGVTLSTADDSRIECAPNPTNNWILIDFPLDVTDCGVGPARLVGWNLLPPGGDTNKSGLIFSLQDTVNVTIGGVQASNWYTRYADVGSGNVNLQLFDENWERSIKALGAKCDGVTDDTRAVQDSVYYAERYTGVVDYPLGTNITLQTSVWVTNGVPITIRGHDSKIHVYYSQPGDVTNARYSGAFIFGSASDNCIVDGLHFKNISTSAQPGGYFDYREEVTTSGTYIPIIINLATNTVIKNNTFDCPTGRGIWSSGSYTDIHNNKFLNGSGISFGVGQPHNWLFFENTVPLGADQIYLSPIGCKVNDNYFTGSNAWKHIVFFSSANKFSFSRNKMIDIWTPIGAVTCYSGDLGVTDSRGTNVYEYSGSISDNTITGTFGSEGAIRVTLITPTNYIWAIDPSFNPDNMYSTVIAENNHINGVGDGYQLVKAKGTRIIGGDCRITGTSLRLYGDCDGIEVNGGYFKTDGLDSQAVVLGTAFLAPSNFRNVKFRNSTFVVGPAAEYWMRDISNFIDSFLVENCDIHFLGAAGSGDAPRVFQFTVSPTNYIKFVETRFHLTNSMSLRALGTLSGTNSDFVLIGCQTIPLSSTAVLRGPTINGGRVELRGNTFGAVEIVGADMATVTDNQLTYPDGLPPLSISGSTRVASISVNRIKHNNTISAVAVTVSATNSTFANNIVTGFSGGDIVTASLGKMYVHNNIILNSGAGSVFPTASGTGQISDDIYERPLHVDSGADPRRMLEFRRTGTVGILGINPNDGDAFFESWATITNSVNGHRFWVHHNNTPTNQFFQTLAITQGRVSLGTSTNFVELMMPLMPNALLRTDSSGIVNTTLFGAGLTWDGTTLGSTGGGGGTNQTPWFQDIDGNQKYLTNAAGITLRSTTASAVTVITSNTVAAATFGIDAIGDATVNTRSGGQLNFQEGGLIKAYMNTAGFHAVGVRDIGNSVEPWNQLWLTTVGIDMAGIIVRPGTGDPEGVVSASPGSVFLRTNGVAGTAMYVKQSGTTNMSDWAMVPIQDVWVLSCSDLTSVVTAGTGKAYFRAPFPMTLVSVRAYLFTAQSTGSLITLDLNETGSSMLGTKITIDNAEEDSRTAAAAATITDTTIADGAKLTVDIDGVGDGTARGLIIELITHR